MRHCRPRAIRPGRRTSGLRKALSRNLDQARPHPPPGHRARLRAGRAPEASPILRNRSLPDIPQRNTGTHRDARLRRILRTRRLRILHPSPQSRLHNRLPTPPTPNPLLAPSHTPLPPQSPRAPPRHSPPPLLAPPSPPLSRFLRAKARKSQQSN